MVVFMCNRPLDKVQLGGLDCTNEMYCLMYQTVHEEELERKKNQRNQSLHFLVYPPLPIWCEETKFC